VLTDAGNDGDVLLGVGGVQQRPEATCPGSHLACVFGGGGWMEGGEGGAEGGRSWGLGAGGEGGGGYSGCIVGS
jgi:hypothetical protein